jgi:hypothetical protein
MRRLLAQSAALSTAGGVTEAVAATAQQAGEAIALVLVVAAAGLASGQGSPTPLKSHVYNVLSGAGRLAPEALHQLRGSVQAYTLEEHELRARADHRKAANLLTLALGNELGLTTQHDWHRELPQRVERLLDDCPTS